MKLSSMLAAFGAAVAAIGLVPYQIEKDEETGEKKVRALLWEASRVPSEETGEKELSIHLGFFNPLKKRSAEEQLFADDVTVDYGAIDEDDDAEAESCAEEVEVVDVVEPVTAEDLADEEATVTETEETVEADDDMEVEDEVEMAEEDAEDESKFFDDEE